MRPQSDKSENAPDDIAERRVLLIDSHAVCCAGIRTMLDGSEFRVEEEVETGEEALKATLRLNPHLVVLEIRMLEGDGLNLLKALKAEHPLTPVVVVTFCRNPIYLAGAIAGGASAYLLKGLEREELLRAFRHVLEGKTLLGPRDLLRSVRGSEEVIDSADLIHPLSRRESDVLPLLGLGLRNGDIARLLAISETTVKTHVEHIVVKLGLSDRLQAAVWAARHAAGRNGAPPVQPR